MPKRSKDADVDRAAEELSRLLLAKSPANKKLGLPPRPPKVTAAPVALLDERADDEVMVPLPTVLDSQIPSPCPSCLRTTEENKRLKYELKQLRRHLRKVVIERDVLLARSPPPKVRMNNCATSPPSFLSADREVAASAKSLQAELQLKDARILELENELSEALCRGPPGELAISEHRDLALEDLQQWLHNQLCTESHPHN